MSKEIKITIVTDDGKVNTKLNVQNRDAVVVTHDSAATVMSTLLKNNLIRGSFCGGRGDCGRCKIQFLEGVPIPTPLERSVMEPEELRCGYRLACLTKPKDDCVIKLALVEDARIEIVSDMIDVTEKSDHLSQQKKRSQNQKSDVMKYAKISQKELSEQLYKTGDIFEDETDDIFYVEKDLIIAVDLGTTTIAMQLMGMESGRVLDTYCEMNPQRRYGSDVLSRIKASCEGGREILQQLVIEVLERGVSQFERCLAGRETETQTKADWWSGTETKLGKGTGIRTMCIAGNTTMEHLLMGYDVSTLGRSPFTPVEIGLQEYRNPAWNFKVWLVPGISAFVGGDIVAGLYALDMLSKACGEERVKEDCDVQNENVPQDNSQAQIMTEVQNKVQDKNETYATLLIDLGTNGEMAITDGTRMIVTATAAGPAFEGGAGAGVIGSDMIACAASLLRQGILDETGLLAEPYFSEGVTVGEPAVRLYNKDIRDLQMAKAAVRAGIEILWRQMAMPELWHVYLAGGFGYYLDVEAAFAIGLLPEFMRGRVSSVGNTSLAGAFMIGRDLWKQQTDKGWLERRLSSIEKINLAEQEGFEKLYLQYMHLGQ